MREEIPRKLAFAMLNKERSVEPPLLLIGRSTHRLDIVVVIVTEIGRLQERAQWQELRKGIVISPRITINIHNMRLSTVLYPLRDTFSISRWSAKMTRAKSEQPTQGKSSQLFC